VSNVIFISAKAETREADYKFRRQQSRQMSQREMERLPPLRSKAEIVLGSMFCGVALVVGVICFVI